MIFDAPSTPRTARSTHFAWGACLAIGLLSGCRLTGTDGPVSRSVINSRQLAQRGVTALERRDWKAAEELLEQAVHECPVDANSRRLYAEILWQQGRRADALVHLDEAIRLSGGDASYLARAGEMRLEMGEAAEALALADRAIDASPRMTSAWILRGRVYKQAGQPRAALADFHRALGFDPANRQALAELAEVYTLIGEPRRSIGNLQSLADTYLPGEEPQELLYSMGCAYLSMGRYDDAVSRLNVARDRGPPTAELLCRLGEAEMLAGRTREAQVAFEQAIALDPSHMPSRDMMARMANAPAYAGDTRLR